MKILVVDDHSYNRDMLGFMLEDHSHDVVFAVNGEDAYKRVCDELDIDLVLMDVMMPVMDGMEATREIKSHCSERFLPVVFITALDNEKQITSCLESGGDDFVPKPVNENVLVAKVKALERTKALYDRLHNVNKELTFHRQMMDREHSIVEHIFNNASARVPTQCESVELYTSPMSLFNGDLVLTAPSPSGGVYALIGDFTGHGLAASIGSLPATEIFFRFVNRQASVSQLASELNHQLHILLPKNMFFCAGIAEIDYAGETMTLWLGGMNDMLVVDDKKKCLTRIESEHMPLGILSDEEFDESPSVINMASNSRFYIYTDGVIEAQNQNQEEFGQQRLEDIILTSQVKTLPAIVDAVDKFTSGKEQTDDVSILELFPGLVKHRDKKTGDIVDVGAKYHDMNAVPWQLRLILRDDDLKSASVVDQVMSFVSSIQGIELHQDKIFTIVSELYNNSLEHGVLRLNSSMKSGADGFEQYYKLREQRLNDLANQSISISFDYLRGNPNQLKLMIEDSGDGFNAQDITAKELSNENSHGRGMQLLHVLCSSLTYGQGGRRVTAIYDLCRH